MSLHRYIAVLILLLACSPWRTQAEPLYNVTFLPVGYLTPTAMNNAGQIVGSVAVGDGTTRVGLYSNGAMQDLGLAPNSRASAINDAGAITGMTTLNNEDHGYLYQNDSLVDLGANTSGLGINAQGDVVGSNRTNAGTFGFVYSGGTFTQLPSVIPSRMSAAVDINDRGDIAGYSYADEFTHPPLRSYLYQNGTLLDLGNLNSSLQTAAAAINNAGQIAGRATVINNDHAFLYEAGVMKDLGSFGGHSLNVVDLNEHGTLFGNGETANGDYIAFMSIGDALVDLNTLLVPGGGWRIRYAYAGNDLGQIVGYGCQLGTCGVVQLDLASAVPEPSAMSTLIPGLLVLLGTHRRARRK